MLAFALSTNNQPTDLASTYLINIYSNIYRKKKLNLGFFSTGCSFILTYGNKFKSEQCFSYFLFFPFDVVVVGVSK